MSRNRRSLARDLRAAATAHQPEPDPQFVDRLGRRLAGLDAADADAGTTGSNVVAFGRRLSRGAAIGLVAAVISAAGAAAVALVAVHHDSPPPTTTVPATTATT
ncbi:MAG: hypothetical protein JWM34_942, partial [Ilumatobacteraceae bacterium]|nr:hypothetical protein [Ilumatobacteraceae bacterium]